MGVGGLIALAGGSATVAWSFGAGGASGLLEALVLPLVARVRRPSFLLTGAALVPAVLGGLAYAVFRNDVVWWVAGLGAVPAVTVLVYFDDPRIRRAPATLGEGAWDAPGGFGGGGGDGGGGGG